MPASVMPSRVRAMRQRFDGTGGFVRRTFCWARSEARHSRTGAGRWRLSLHLAALLTAGYIRYERDDPASSQVRRRFYRGERGVIVIQTRQDAPALMKSYGVEAAERQIRDADAT